MTNIIFPDEEIQKDDLYFMCFIVEKIARTLHQHNKYVVNTIGKEKLVKKISLANVLHCENSAKVVDDFIKEFDLQYGNFDITQVDQSLVEKIPTETQMGKVYSRLILQTLDSREDYIDGMIRIYNSWIADKIDDYEGSAYYEPSYILKRAYNENSFNGV